MFDQFRLEVQTLHFYEHARQADLSAVLTLGKRSLRWDLRDGTEVDALRLIDFLRNAVKQWQHPGSFAVGDLSDTHRRIIATGSRMGKIPMGISIEVDGRLYAKGSVFAGDVVGALSNLSRAVLVYSIHHFPIEVTRHWARLLSGEPERETRLQIGQRVRTVVGENVKTVREGWIYATDYHFKREQTIYQLLIGDRVYKKRYFDGDLVLS